MVMVYLVTSGEYSSYGVDGVFSSEQLANEFAEKTVDAQVGSWELDERSQDEDCVYWCAVLDLATGSLEDGGCGSELANSESRAGFVKHANYICGAYPKGYIYSRSYVSQEHASKLCVEKKQEIQRQGG